MSEETAIMLLEHTGYDDLNLEEHQIKGRLEAIEVLIKQNKQLKEELQKADSITQSCIFEGKEESTINFRECLNKLKLYKEVIEELREYTEELKPHWLGNDLVLKIIDDLLQILDKVKGE